MSRETHSLERGLACAAMAVTLGAGAAEAATLSVPAAFPTIQDAVDAAIDGDVVLVADGAYAEDVDIIGKSITLRSASNDPDLCTIDGSFTGVSIVGAVTTIDVTVRGFTIRDCPTRAIAVTGTVDARVDNCIIEECTSTGAVFMSGTSLRLTDSIVRDNASTSNGAGVWIAAGEAEIRRTRFEDNAAGGGNPYGGALYVAGDSPLLVADCVFLRNSAIGTVAGRGGGLGVQGGSLLPIMVANTIFDDNEASDRGGGLYIEYRGAILANVEVTNNIALGGGGMFLENTGGAPVDFVVANALVADNAATNGSGGGIRLTQDAELVVTNATVFRNTASGFAGGGVANGTNSAATCTNCIVGGNSPDDFAGLGTRTVTYSNVEDGFAGEGNISEPPLFIDVNGGDYRLAAGSPCIDAGNTLAPVGPAMDLDGSARVVDDPDTASTGLGLSNGAIDMGAYEFQLVDTCPQDVTDDGQIGFADLLQILSTWGPCP